MSVFKPLCTDCIKKGNHKNKETLCDDCDELFDDENEPALSIEDFCDAYERNNP